MSVNGVQGVCEVAVVGDDVDVVHIGKDGGGRGLVELLVGVVEGGV